MGIRADREYAAEPPPGILRIAVFGDSYAAGWDVSNEEVWASQLESMDPSIEVLNYGVAMYGLDQAFLRYQSEGKRLHPRIVIIGFMPDDIERGINTFRPFRFDDDAALAKPRFTFRDGRLALIPNPLPNKESYQQLLADEESVLTRLGRDDSYYANGSKPGRLDLFATTRLLKLTANILQARGGIYTNGHYNESSEAFGVTSGVFDMFYQSIKDTGAEPVIMLFPSPPDVGRYVHRRSSRYAPLLDYFRARRYNVIDLSDMLSGYSTSELESAVFTKGGHYTAYWNRVVSKRVLEFAKTWRNDHR